MSAHELVRRQQAVAKARARFDGKSFMLGRRDCIHLAAAMLRAMGHKPPSIPPYKGETGALRRLKEQGCETIADLLDKVGLRRIAPASAMPGDLLFLPGDGGEGIGAVGIALGNGALLGFHEDHVGLVTMRALDVSAAWSVLK